MKTEKIIIEQLKLLERNRDDYATGTYKTLCDDELKSVIDIIHEIEIQLLKWVLK
jgi:hypothetical protein